ncbi:MAG: arginine decarboxylase, pyruvoyl-dependent [Candidatus Thermoplasmatota archaeon]|nr:arginine decarboxylase, pyruvoyl-dependent [Candidatus Thermoplasmatota archaeon]
MIPAKLFLTKGVGKHKDQLQSFELALRNAGIALCNLVEVSSIAPPNCKIISAKEGKSYIRPGEITFSVMAKNSTNEPNRLVAASIGLALPKDRNLYGYLSEYHSWGEMAKKAGDYAEDLAATMLATTLGLEFDPEKAWDERKQEYRMSGRIVRSRNITQSARGDTNGLWTTVIAAAIFVMDE